MPEYKYWTPILFTELTVLEKMGCWSIDLLPLAKFYDYVCSAVILISLNSVINRRPAVISLNAWCPLVFERPFVVSLLLRLFPVGIPWITIQCAFISVLSPKVHTCTWRRHLAMIMTEITASLCNELTSACASFSSMSSFLTSRLLTSCLLTSRLLTSRLLFISFITGASLVVLSLWCFSCGASRVM